MAGRRSIRGYSLVEVLLALAITLVVMALVARTMQDVSRIYQTQKDLAVASGSVTLALDDIAYELSFAGQGLGEGVAAVLPRLPGDLAGVSTLTVRSNPKLRAGYFLAAVADAGEDVAMRGAESFESGESVLLTDATGRTELAEILRASSSTVALRSRESEEGAFLAPFTPQAAARALGVREVRYFLRASSGDGALELVKDVSGTGSRVLTRDVRSLRFDYLDRDQEPIAFGKIEDEDAELSTVRVTLDYLPAEGALQPLSLSTAVTLAPRSGTFDFEKPGFGFRLSRVFHPIEHPVGVASRVGADWAVILAAGGRPRRDPAYVYVYPLEKKFLDPGVDAVASFEDVRSPVALAFGPEGFELAGSLFVAARGLRVGQLTRMAPDASGRLSAGSKTFTFERTDAVAEAGGMAFGVDNALYVTSRESGAIFRFRFEGRSPGTPERLFALPGTPGAIAEGTDGTLYFLMEQGDGGSVWKLRFDETLTPLEPVPVGALPGVGLSLARDPVSGSLFALVRARDGDDVVVELDRRWLRLGEASEKAPPVLFSLREWQRKLEEGRVAPGEIPFPKAELPEKMSALRADALDFVSFDAVGSLYLGTEEANLVLQFELARPSGRYAVGVAGGVVERGGGGLRPHVRFHAWKKSVLGL